MTQKNLLISGVRVWDGRGERRSRELCSIRIRDGRIEALGPEPELAQPEAGMEVFHYGPTATGSSADVTVLPGLIDSHVHLTLDPAVPNATAQLAISQDELYRGMTARAESMVRAGITTARDLGAGKWQELALRDAIAAGERLGPRLLCAGQPVTTPGGHCHFWGGEARGSDEIRRVVERQVRHGVDWIKVMATGGVFTRGTDVTAPQYSQLELRDLVVCAESHGRAVAAHCHGTAGIRNAVQAGVRTVEHCSFAGGQGFGSDLDARLVARIAGSQAWVSPTVNAGWARRREKDGAPTAFFERMSLCLRSLREAGARFIASTDAGIPNVEHHRLAEALEAFSSYAAASPLETLKSATSEAALALGLAQETGALAPGLAADLLLVEGDPLEDLTVLRTPLLVVARGRPCTPES